MILRSLTKHVRDQNWFAVGLDFFIVVFGVFIGLQVSNWSVARADMARGRAYLGRVSVDLGADIYNYQNSMMFGKHVINYGLTALDYVDTKSVRPDSYWQILLAFYQSSQVDEFLTTQTTYDELTSAGELRLISNTKLRFSIAEYYSSADSPTLSLFPPYREHVRGIIPLKMQAYIWEKCYSEVNNEQQLFACEAPVGSIEAEKIVNQLAADTDLMRELRYWVSNLRVAAIISSSRIDQANAIRELIEAETGIKTETPQ